MGDDAILQMIDAVRSLPAYHAAEVLRRSTLDGSGAMASAPEGSDEKKAIVLLISSWETIAAMLCAMKNKERAFETLPICHMYEALEAALKALGKRVQAEKLGKLREEHRTWLDKRDACYQTAACGGLHAKFG